KLHAQIRDTGIGIPEDKVAVIFEAFQQADGSTTRKYGGTGLGLFICKKISNLMGGEVWAESKVACGSIFHFTAWLEKVAPKKTKRIVDISLSGKKILIVDDTSANLEILTHSLELAGMRVAALQKSQYVLSTLEKAANSSDPFDLCVCDIQMPGMDGLEVARAVRSFRPHQDQEKVISDKMRLLINTLPMIAFSSVMEKGAKECKEAGFNGFLMKPVHRKKLYRMIERLICIHAGQGDEDSISELKNEKSIVTQYSVREEMKRSASILLVEDNPVNQKLASMMLKKAGYQVDVADNGKKAVEQYTASPDKFDMIFMDLQMPEMNGLEATEMIRQQGFDAIPIVAMTANAMKGDREMCLNAGMNDYTTKPIKRETVFAVIEKWVFDRNRTEL
ncbi:MAG: response regulator, partial [Desulfosarcina sp.]|nr:response regulator [Desulfobacterales bacterium]